MAEFLSLVTMIIVLAIISFFERRRKAYSPLAELAWGGVIAGTIIFVLITSFFAFVYLIKVLVT